MCIAELKSLFTCAIIKEILTPVKQTESAFNIEHDIFSPSAAYLLSPHCSGCGDRFAAETQCCAALYPLHTRHFRQSVAMASSAFLTSTFPGQDPARQPQPSVFEILAQQGLVATLGPAADRVAAVAAEMLLSNNFTAVAQMLNRYKVLNSIALHCRCLISTRHCCARTSCCCWPMALCSCTTSRSTTPPSPSSSTAWSAAPAPTTAPASRWPPPGSGSSWRPTSGRSWSPPSSSAEKTSQMALKVLTQS